MILYEMLVGKRPFVGDTVSDTLAAVLTADPDLERVPVAARRLVTACLQRDRERRLRHLGDAWLLLEEEGASSAQETAPARLSWWPIAAALAFGAVATAVALGSWSTPPPSAPVRFLEYPPEGTRFTRAPMPSPDGRRLALHVRGSDGRRGLWVRSLESDVATEISGLGDVRFAFWSADSEELIYTAGTDLRRVRPGGSGNRLIASGFLFAAGGSAAGNGLLVASVDGGILRIDPESGAVESVLDIPGADYRALEPVPGADAMLVFQFGVDTGMYLAGTDGSDPTAVLPGAQTDMHFAAPDWLLYTDNRLLVAQRFAPATGLSGDPRPVAQNVGPGDFEASAAGVVTFLQGAALETRLTWFDREGNDVGTIGPPGQYSEISMSRDGGQILFVLADPATGNRDLWLRDLEGAAPNRFTSSPDVDHLAVFSPDGREIAWEGHRGSELVLLRRPTDFSAEPTQMLGWRGAGGPEAWSPDGSFVVYVSQDGNNTLRNLWAVPMHGEGEAQPLIGTEFDDYDPQFSPDGRWLAYTSDGTGSPELYLQQLDGMHRVGAPQRVSTEGGSRPWWRGDGRELFFLSGGDVMAVAIDLEAERPAGTPARLFSAGERFQGRDFVAAPDGQRFLMLMPADDLGPAAATVILGWSPGDAR